MHSAFPLIPIKHEQTQTDLLKLQKRFNTLIKKIGQQRQQLIEWQSTISLHQQKYAQEFEPLIKTLKTLQSDMVQLLDKSCHTKKFTQNQRKKLGHVICSMAGELIIENNDETLKGIYNKHSDADFDAQYEEDHDAIKRMAKEIWGIELDAEMDVGSLEHLFAQVGEKMQQKIEQEEQAWQEHSQSSKTRKKSAKTMAKEKQQQEEAKNISKSLQEVYRKLASSLHPDREQDPAERDRKTALMKQVNNAYETKDLLRLLELQLEAEHIDQATINTMTQTRLKHYNQILSQQSKELQGEISMICYGLAIRFEIAQEALSTPIKIMRILEADIQAIKQDILKLQKDLVAFQDVKNIKHFLKSYSTAPQSFFEEEEIDMDLEDFFEQTLRS